MCSAEAASAQLRDNQWYVAVSAFSHYIIAIIVTHTHNRVTAFGPGQPR